MNEIIRTEPSQPAAERPAIKELAAKTTLPGSDCVDWLRFIAWVFLLGGIFGGAYTMLVVSEVPQGIYSTKKDPLIIGYGVSIIVSGIFMCALCYTLAAISDNVRLIASNSIKNKVE